MKKLIAILVIAIVMVGAVFAENVAPNVGTANLKVVTLVGVVEPEFKLTTNNASDSGLLVGTPAVVATMDNATETDATANDAYHVIAKNSLVSSAAAQTSVTFYVVQTNDCKSYKTYSFSATAGDLVMVKAYNAAGDLVEYTGTPTAADHRVFEVVNTNGVVDTFGNTGADARFTTLVTDDTATLYKITYTGDEVLGGTVASFTCAWTNDANGVPGQYEADIRLTVTAN